MTILNKMDIKTGVNVTNIVLKPLQIRQTLRALTIHMLNKYLLRIIIIQSNIYNKS